MRVEALKKMMGGAFGSAASASRKAASTRAIWRLSRRRARCSSKREIKSSFGTIGSLAVDPPEFAQRGDLAVVDALDAVPQRQLGDPDVLHQPLETPRLDRGRLVAAPQRAVERDMALDQAGAPGDGHGRRDQAHLAAGVSDGHLELAAQRLDRPKVQLFRFARVAAFRVCQDKTPS